MQKQLLCSLSIREIIQTSSITFPLTRSSEGRKKRMEQNERESEGKEGKKARERERENVRPPGNHPEEYSRRRSLAAGEIDATQQEIKRFLRPEKGKCYENSYLREKPRVF